MQAYGPAVATVTSKTLENAYLSNDKEMSFDAKEQQYTIYLKGKYSLITLLVQNHSANSPICSHTDCFVLPFRNVSAE